MRVPDKFYSLPGSRGFPVAAFPDVLQQSSTIPLFLSTWNVQSGSLLNRTCLPALLQRSRTPLTGSPCKVTEKEVSTILLWGYGAEEGRGCKKRTIQGFVALYIVDTSSSTYIFGCWIGSIVVQSIQQLCIVHIFQFQVWHSELRCGNYRRSKWRWLLRDCFFTRTIV